MDFFVHLMIFTVGVFLGRELARLSATVLAGN